MRGKNYQRNNARKIPQIQPLDMDLHIEMIIKNSTEINGETKLNKTNSDRSLSLQNFITWGIKKDHETLEGQA